MDERKYFEKNGFVYGIEEPAKCCGYSTQCIKFTDLEKAIEWKEKASNAYRYLGTKSHAKHCNFRRGA